MEIVQSYTKPAISSEKKSAKVNILCKYVSTARGIFFLDIYDTRDQLGP